MKFPNAFKGIKKIRLAEILMLITVILTAVYVIVLQKNITKNDTVLMQNISSNVLALSRLNSNS